MNALTAVKPHADGYLLHTGFSFAPLPIASAELTFTAETTNAFFLVAQWPVQALNKSFLRFQVGKILDDLCKHQLQCRR